MDKFDIWFKEHERKVFKGKQGCFDKAYKFGAKQAFIEQQYKIDDLEKRLKGVEEIMNDYYTGSFEDAPELAGWISTALNGDMEV